MRDRSFRRLAAAMLFAFAAGALTAYVNPIEIRAELRGEIAMMEHSAVVLLKVNA